MRILYYTWFENSQEDMVETLLYLGHSVIKCSIPFRNYEEDEEAMEQLSRVIEEYGCDSIFSFNFFPGKFESLLKLYKYSLKSRLYSALNFPGKRFNIKSLAFLVTVSNRTLAPNS